MKQRRHYNGQRFVQNTIQCHFQSCLNTSRQRVVKHVLGSNNDMVAETCQTFLDVISSPSTYPWQSVGQ